MPIDASQMFAYSAELRTYPTRLGKRAADVVRQQAKEVERGAKARAPLGPTGDLKDSIHVVVNGGGGSSSGISLSVVSALRYSAYVEQGDGHGPPQPYMGPALDAQEGEFYDAMQKVAEEGLGG